MEIQLLVPVLAGLAVPTLPAKRMKHTPAPWQEPLSPGETSLGHAWPCSPPPEHHAHHQGQQQCQPHDGHHGNDEHGVLLAGGHCHCEKEAEMVISVLWGRFEERNALVTAPMASLSPPEGLWEQPPSCFSPSSQQFMFWFSFKSPSWWDQPSVLGSAAGSTDRATQHCCTSSWFC